MEIPPLVQAGDLGKYLGGNAFARRIVESGFLEPVVKEHKCVLYSGTAIARVAIGIEGGNIVIPPIKRMSKDQ